MKIHFIGICGKGMLPLAILAKRIGHQVTGSDLQYDTKKDTIKAHAIAKRLIIHQGHAATNIDRDTTLVVRSSNIPDTNPEVIEAKKLCLPIFSRLEMLGKLLRQSQKEVTGIMGTFGKTTTTALLGHILREAGVKPLVYAGGEIQSNLNHSTYSTNKNALVELCEYKGEMFRVDCKRLIITNIEKNHLDYYGSFENMYRAFENYIALNQTALFRNVFVCNESAGTKRLIAKFPKQCITYGFKNAQWTARHIEYKQNSTTFEVYHRSQPFGRFTISLVGKHNVLNALVSIVVAHTLGADTKSIRDSLAIFKPLRQRCEETYADQSVTLVTDNARLPSQISCAIDSIRQKYPDRSINIVAGIWGRLNKRELDEYAKVMKAGDAILLAPLENNAAKHGGAEDNDADHKLAKLINQNPKTKAFTTGHADQFISHLRQSSTTKPASVVLLGYESYRPFLNTISNQIIKALHAH